MKTATLNPSRRNFLRTASVAAAAGLTLADARLFAAPAAGQGAESAAKFQLFTDAAIQEDVKALEAAPGNKSLVDGKIFTVVVTVEKAKSATEFEWHEGRDHILQILDGSTVYEVGGSPKNGRNIRPGEWLAPESEGATKMTLNKGDMLVIPRGTPHKRSTAGSVALTLISTMGTVTA
ncbi:MAG TPA: twin-arginine translocation signal domain-containing protein [Terracidiphilus sp.]|nr:twin-arginine translocation signal domain-containing protein [Terracidiphilus sp.]HUX28553.1 twin-arginine translocation signal domain-containing protein [Terracidiphilus sp.]